jgi:hypothetical protein
MSDSQAELKTYSSPTLNKLAPEQALLWLTGKVMQGDQGAKDLLDVLFPGPHEHEKVSPPIEGEKPGGFVTENPSGASRLFFHVVTPIRESFRRFVRG